MYLLYLSANQNLNIMDEIIKKNGIIYGIVSGLISILILTIIYCFDVTLFVSTWITFLKVIVFVLLSILLITKTKKQLNGNLNFKDTFTTYFIFAVVALLVTTIFEIILFNLIDPSLKDTLKELLTKAIIGFLEKFNTPAAQVNEAVRKIQENDQFSVFELIKGYFSYLIISAIFGLILAAIFKSKSPSSQGL